MTRLLILGAAPLPHEPQERQFAANLRTWHFTKPLLDDGHQVRLVGGRIPKTYPEGTEPVLRKEKGRLEYLSVAADRFEDRSFLQKLCDEFDPEAVLGVNTYPASRAVRLDTDKPIWCDLNGWIMAEGQSKAHVYRDDSYLSHFWQMERAVLERADVISTVSKAQSHATVGELAVMGRLGHKSFGYEFVHVVPNAVSDVQFDRETTNRRVVRGIKVAENDFVVLWVGGYNTWTDVDTLFAGLVSAMARDESIHFVSTGGAIEGHDDITFARFRRLAGESSFSDRFHFAGWVPTVDMPLYYSESDLGVNIDGRNYETVYGARNRVNEMMKAGLPVLTTLGTEVSRELAEHDLCLSVELGDASELGSRVSWAVAHPAELRDMASNAKVFARERYSYTSTTEPMRRWAKTPRRAPDNGVRVEFEDLDLYRGANHIQASEVDEYLSELRRVGSELKRTVSELSTRERDLRTMEDRYHEVRSELGEIHQSKMWRAWMRYLKLRDMLRLRL